MTSDLHVWPSSRPGCTWPHDVHGHRFAPPRSRCL